MYSFLLRISTIAAMCSSLFLNHRPKFSLHLQATSNPTDFFRLVLPALLAKLYIKKHS
jgi:hypothetical protein